MSTTSSSIVLAAILPLYVASVAALADEPATLSEAKTQARLQPYEAVEPHMGTLVRIKLYAANQEQAHLAFRAAFDRIGQLDEILSDYKPESELNRICRTAVGSPVRVSEDLFRVIEASQKLSAETGGAFDITLGPLTHLWREARKNRSLPDASTLQAAKARCDYRKLHVDASRQTIQFDSTDMQLDAGGITKGYAADEALRVLSEMGIGSSLVAVSGDLVCSGAPPGEAGWKIGIDAADSAGAPFTRVLLLTRAAVSTSGNNEQHIDVDGKRYSHIIDPKTGMGLTTGITVTVVAKHGIDADAAATAVSVLGRDKGLQFIGKRSDLAALVITNENGRSEVTQSSNFDPYR